MKLSFLSVKIDIIGSLPVCRTGNAAEQYLLTVDYGGGYTALDMKRYR